MWGAWGCGRGLTLFVPRLVLIVLALIVPAVAALPLTFVSCAAVRFVRRVVFIGVVLRCLRRAVTSFVITIFDTNPDSGGEYQRSGEYRTDRAEDERGNAIDSVQSTPKRLTRCGGRIGGTTVRCGR